MGVELRRLLVWATALASVASAMLIASTDGALPNFGLERARAAVVETSATVERARAVFGANNPRRGAGPAGSAR